MKIELAPGETITVTFKDSDGEIAVAFNLASLTVTADLPDSQGREGIIYEEAWGFELL